MQSMMVRGFIVAQLLVFTGSAQTEAGGRLTVLSPTPPPDLRSIRMVDERRGWTTGAQGLWFTNDGAKTWRNIPIGKAVVLGPSWGVIGNGEMWALTQDFMRTPAVELLHATPGGAVGHLAIPCGTVAVCDPVTADFSSDGKIGFLFALTSAPEARREGQASSGATSERRLLVFKTGNGGGTWIQMAAPDTRVYKEDAMQAKMSRGNMVGLVVGCEVYNSSDGGNSWRKVNFRKFEKIVCGELAIPITIRFGPDGTGWLRTFNGWIFEKRNGGDVWSVSSLGHHKTNLFPLTRDEWISFGDSSHGLAVIEAKVFATSDGGLKWKSLNTSNSRYWSVSCVKERCVLVSENSTLQFVFDM